MDILEWARGPLLTGSLFVFAAGVFWRLFCLWREQIDATGADTVVVSCVSCQAECARGLQRF